MIEVSVLERWENLRAKKSVDPLLQLCTCSPIQGSVIIFIRNS